MNTGALMRADNCESSINKLKKSLELTERKIYTFCIVYNELIKNIAKQCKTWKCHLQKKGTGCTKFIIMPISKNRTLRKKIMRCLNFN